MINFRYHVVSLTAVFLALAIGLVVGTAALNGPVADNLKSQITALNKDLSNKRDEINQYREEINRSQEFATEIAPALLDGKLAGRKLAVVALPGTDQYADKVIQMLAITGVTVTAKVTVQDKFFDPAVELELLDLASVTSQPTISTADLPVNSNGVETASAQLALALLQRPSVAGAAPVTQPSAADVTAVLTAYTKASYIAVEDDAVGGAEATLIITGAPAVDKDAAKKAQSLVSMAEQFSDERRLIVAGVGVGEGNLISAVRGDPTLNKKISTVDNVSTTDGQVASAMATVERVVDDKTGHYGLAAGAASLVPKAAS
ncbi:copper transporter [Paractinoplanes lichenicola]|uniref:Copper transporter n=1 Tax=Paractinoplanes lichenicola TaxID=2802976 RepID=A0ABS1W478_9ACTN|nr:copper transporter [Actinoplanes lichenicola]MBL7261540.1 copper transporter [Actinoplanes lichenicola]